MKVVVPTEKQFERLKVLIGHIVLTPGFREWQAIVNRGWVEAAWGNKLEVKQSGRRKSWPPLQLSPDGYRAMAAAIERYGWREERPNSRAEAVA